MRVKELDPLDINFVSMVDEPANQEAWEIAKALESKKKEVNMHKKQAVRMFKSKGKAIVEPVRIKFEKSSYSSKDMVKAVLISKGYKGFDDEIEETETEFIVSQKDLSKYEDETRLIKSGVGVTTETGTLKEGEKENVDLPDGVGAQVEESTETDGTAEDDEDSTEEDEEEVEEESTGKDAEKSVKKQLSLKELSNTKEDSKETLIVKGKTVSEIIKLYNDILEKAQKTKSFTPWMCEYTGADDFEDALRQGGYDGSIPGMDDVIITLNSFAKVAFKAGNQDLIASAFNDAGEYLKGLKELFDKYAMSDFAKHLIFGFDEAKEETTETVKEKEDKTKSAVTAEVKALEEFKKAQAKGLDDMFDLIKTGIETVNANIVKSHERIETKFGESLTKVEEISKSLDQITNAEPDRTLEKPVQEPTQESTLAKRKETLGGLDWTKAIEK